MSWKTRIMGAWNVLTPGLGYLLIGEGCVKAIKAQAVFLILFFSGIGTPIALLYALLIGYDGYQIAKEKEKDS